MDAFGINRENKPLHSPTSNDVSVKNFGNISLVFKSVPDGFRVNDHNWTVVADIHATSVVNTDAPHAMCHHKAAHVVTKLPAALAAAGAPPVGRRSLVGATENVDTIHRLVA